MKPTLRTSKRRSRGRAWLTAATVCAAFAGVALAAGTLVTNYGAANVFGRATSGVHDPSDPYVVGLFVCEARLRPQNATEIPGTAGNFFNVLSAAFPGYTYQSSVRPLSAGSLIVKTYDVQGTPARVGAEFHVIYQPGAGDPAANVHWIQVVTDNHNVTNNPGHGNAENIVDLAGGATTPYYDDGFAADNGNCAAGCDFYDFPGRTDTTNPHTWNADLYVVTGPAIGAGAGNIVLQHPGIRWGWENSCVNLGVIIGWAVSNAFRLVFVADQPVRPGAFAVFQLQGPATLGVTHRATVSHDDDVPPLPGPKGTLDSDAPPLPDEEPVPDDETVETGELTVAQASLGVLFSPDLDHRGTGALSFAGGFGQVEGFTLGGQTYGPGTFFVEQGSGWVDWPTGEASAELRLRVRSADLDLTMTAVGHGKIEADTGRFELAENAQITEVRVEGVPAPPVLTQALTSFGPWAGLPPALAAAICLAIGLVRRRTVVAAPQPA